MLCYIFPSFYRSNNNRGSGAGRYSQRDNYQQRDYQQRGGDYNNSNNYNNNRYQNGDASERGGGNWNNRGGSRTFTRSGPPPDSRYGNTQQQQLPPNADLPETPQVDEPINTRWQEPPPSQDSSSRYNNSGGGYGGKWNQRSETVDYTVPLPRDERIELELFGTANTGINFNKYEDIPVEATGHDVPPHITSFDDIKLTDIIRSNVKMARYDKPTPVQKYAIPIVLAGRDLMSCAQTGSG